MNSPSPKPRVEIAETVHQAPAGIAGLQFTVGKEPPKPDRTQRASLTLYKMGFNIGPTRHGMKLPYLWRIFAGARLQAPDAKTKRGNAFEKFLDVFDKGAGIFVLPGRLSMNLAIIDCDTREASEFHETQFAKRGIKPWIVESSPGHLHFWFLSADGELDNIKDGDGWQLWGNLHFCVAPPSVHPETGQPYQWRYPREGPQIGGHLPPILGREVLDWLPLKLAKEKRRVPTFTDDSIYACLSRRNRDFLENGAPESTRNNRLIACANDCHGNNIPLEIAEPDLTRAALACGLERKETKHAIRNAYSEPKAPARKSKQAITPNWVHVLRWVLKQKWTRLEGTRYRSRWSKAGTRVSISAETARAVMIACCYRSFCQDDAQPFRASTREIAELANISQVTGYNALLCLSQNQYLEHSGYTQYFGASLFSFGKKANAQKQYNEPSGKLSSVSEMRAWLEGQFSPYREDVFRPGALGKLAGRVWEIILIEALTVKQIAQRLDCNAGTIRRVLGRLNDERAGLAKRTGKGRGVQWVGIGAGDEDLRQIAGRYGTRNKAADRKKMYKCEREARVTDRVLRIRKQKDEPKRGRAK